MSFCQQCGSWSSPEDAFCGQCGRTLVKGAATTSPRPRTEPSEAHDPSLGEVEPAPHEAASHRTAPEVTANHGILPSDGPEIQPLGSGEVPSGPCEREKIDAEPGASNPPSIGEEAIRQGSASTTFGDGDDATPDARRNSPPIAPPSPQYNQMPPGPPPTWPESASPPPGNYAPPPSYQPGWNQNPPIGTYGQLADWGIRAVASLIDGALTLPVFILFSALGHVSSVFSVIGLLAVLAIVALFAVQIGETGQSPGMRVMGVKCVGLNGHTIGGGLGVVRAIATVLNSIVCYIGWLLPLWDNQRQTLADKVMSTVVITVPKQRFSLVPST